MEIKLYINSRNSILINFTRPGIKFCLSLHYNGSNGFLFVKATKIYLYKAKNSRIKNILRV